MPGENKRRYQTTIGNYYWKSLFGKNVFSNSICLFEVISKSLCFLHLNAFSFTFCSINKSSLVLAVFVKARRSILVKLLWKSKSWNWGYTIQVYLRGSSIYGDLQPKTYNCTINPSRPCISESCIKIKINLNFYFQSLVDITSENWHQLLKHIIIAGWWRKWRNPVFKQQHPDS